MTHSYPTGRSSDLRLLKAVTLRLEAQAKRERGREIAAVARAGDLLGRRERAGRRRVILGIERGLQSLGRGPLLLVQGNGPLLLGQPRRRGRDQAQIGRAHV